MDEAQCGVRDPPRMYWYVPCGDRFVGFIQWNATGPGTALAHSRHIISVCWVSGGIKDSESLAPGDASVWHCTPLSSPSTAEPLSDGTFPWSWGLLLCPHPVLSLALAWVPSRVSLPDDIFALCLVTQLCLTLCEPGLEPTRLLCQWGFPMQEFRSGLPCPPPGNHLYIIFNSLRKSFAAQWLGVVLLALPTHLTSLVYRPHLCYAV